MFTFPLCMRGSVYKNDCLNFIKIDLYIALKTDVYYIMRKIKVALLRTSIFSRLTFNLSCASISPSLFLYILYSLPVPLISLTACVCVCVSLSLSLSLTLALSVTLCIRTRPFIYCRQLSVSVPLPLLCLVNPWFQC